MDGTFDICIVGQSGRLSFEAVLFAASLRHSAPDFQGALIVGEPQPGANWPRDPRMDDACKALLKQLGATILPFENQHFGASYPQGNKVEMLAAMTPERPFVFFDTDTLILGDISGIPFDFDRPSASLARENTWPNVPLYGPTIADIWQAVFDLASVDIQPSLDQTLPENQWERYSYFNAGWFFYQCPRVFGEKMTDLMVALRDQTPEALASQSLDPWLDQVALPAVVTGLGGGRPDESLDGLDGGLSLHWRALPLLYAKAGDEVVTFLETITAPNRIKKVLKEYEPFKRMIYHGRGAKVRALFDQNDLPQTEKPIRNRIKRAKLWMR